LGRQNPLAQQSRHKPHLGGPDGYGPPFGQSGLEKYSTYSDISPLLAQFLNNSGFFLRVLVASGLGQEEARNRSKMLRAQHLKPN
jgi:hypothetical protein